MSNDTSRSSGPGRVGRGISAVTSGTLRLLGDLLVVSLWVLLLTLLFLETAWPRWAFYVLLLGGIGLYVSATGNWLRGAGEN